MNKWMNEWMNEWRNETINYFAVALSLAAPAGDVALPDLDPKDVASSFLGCPVILSLV